MAFQRPNRRRLLTAVKSRSTVSLKLPVKQITREISTATADKFRFLFVFKDFLLWGIFVAHPPLAVLPLPPGWCQSAAEVRCGRWEIAGADRRNGLGKGPQRGTAVSSSCWSVRARALRMLARWRSLTGSPERSASKCTSSTNDPKRSSRIVMGLTSSSLNRRGEHPPKLVIANKGETVCPASYVCIAIRSSGMDDQQKGNR